MKLLVVLVGYIGFCLWLARRMGREADQLEQRNRMLKVLLDEDQERVA